MAKLTKLFEPIKLGPLELPNRIIWPAITTFYDTNYDLKREERSAYFYAELAKGGAGLLIVGALQVLYPGRRDPERVAINSDKWIPHLQLWTKAIHDNGGIAAAQLAVWNYWAKDGVELHAEDISPSGVVTWQTEPSEDLPYIAFVPESRPLTVEEIEQIEEQIGDAAARAAEAGFDAIELPAVAGNLLNRFITPYTNRRIDEYGGSLENRLRILTETIANIKRKVGDTFPLICRISGTDLMPWGLNLEDVQEFAPIIEKAGVHAISVFAGWYESSQPKYQMCVPRGAFVYLAEGIKQVVNIPVCTNIRINDPILAEQILAEGKADLIAMGRPLVADPELPKKAKEGRLDDIRLCTACCDCFDDIIVKGPLGCSVNARIGKETVYSITPTDKPKKVYVIGGGPAGMETARVATLRGHQVTLFEREDRLGGQLLYAVLPPYKKEWNTLIDYLSTQMRKLHVDVRLGVEATTKIVEEGKSDAVIVATGTVPIIPKIPGINGQNVAGAIDVLTGNKEVGRSLVIIGGGLIGCETAEFLSQKGKEVTILEMLPCIGENIGYSNRGVILNRLTAAGVRMEVKAKVQEITESGVWVTRYGSSEFFEADSVVVAAGMTSVDNLTKQLEGKVAAVYKLGASGKHRRIKQAVEEGFQAGLQV